MTNDFTIFFTFFADGDIRRKYIEIALNTLFEENNYQNVPIIVIDASSDNYSKKNKSLFSNFSNVTYINDEEINPFKRCNKYLHLIKTPYILRLLEDCAYINLGKNNFSFIKNDISLMQRNSEINVIQYPIINEQKFIVRDNTVYYPSTKFEDKVLLEDEGYVYYDRSQERKICHYLCNNILYRTNFFVDHWKYVSSKYDNHNSGESGDINNRFYKFLLKIKYVGSLARLIVRIIEKILYSKFIIRNIFITETMLNSEVIHIGYYSTEANNSSNVVREKDQSNQDGTFSILQNLEVFNDINLLDNISFQSDKTM